MHKPEANAPAAEKTSASGEVTQAASKADMFSSHLLAQNITCFSKNALEDRLQTVVFASNFRLQDGAALPFSILFDNSIYVTIRIRILPEAINCDNHYEMLNYINLTNTHYKIFKYMAAANGDLVLDACMTFLPDSFSAALVLQMLDTIQEHLKEAYPLWQQRADSEARAPILQ